MPNKLVLLLGALMPLCAQTASLSGLVQDPMGAVVANAQVTLNPGSPSSRMTSTGTDGRYQMENLANGPATLSVEAQGFGRVNKTVQISEIGRAHV